jgi:hypothetical protein
VTPLWLVLAVVGWLGCGFVGVGFEYASLVRTYGGGRVQERENAGFTLVMGLLDGPAWLLITFMCGGFGAHGWLMPGRRTK